jgi:dihydrofolate reductase
MIKNLGLVLAYSTAERAIGKSGTLPWHLPEDLKRFKEITTGNIILMGRKTFESLGRVLPNREHWVVTRDATYRAPEGVKVFHSVEEVKRAADARPAGDPRKIFLIGGEEMVRIFLHEISDYFLTEIETSIPDADAFFPALPSETADWSHTYSEWTISKSGLRYRYLNVSGPGSSE